MPEKVTKDFIHIPAHGVDDSQFVADFGRIITVDKGRGVKANLGKLKSTGKTRIRSYLFPTKKFTKTQARAWVKSHSKEETDMETNYDEMIGEAVWTQKYVNDLNDGSFLYIKPGGSKDASGKTKPRSLRMFPYKDADGKVDLPHLRNALARIPQSNLSADVKKRVASKARGIAKKQGIDTSEEFLDEANLRWPLTYPAIFETLIAFNNGELFECYGYDQACMYGRKLARRLSQSVSSYVDDQQYDEEGNSVSSSSQSDNENRTMYKYHDGQVIVVKSKGSSSGLTEWEYSDESEADDLEEGIESDDDSEAVAESESDNIFEAYTTGDMIKAMRTKKKMSRTDMAAKMNMSKSRLTEIEDDVDEPDDDELNEIASALGMTPKRMRKMMDAMMGSDEEDAEAEAAEETIEVIDIIGEEDGVYDIVEIAGNVVESAKEEKNIFTKEVYEERLVHGEKVTTHRFIGDFISEEIEEKADGTLRFKVPLFKIGELTSNGNRYTTKCAENLINDLGALRKKFVKKESSHKKTVLDIGIGESIEGMTPKELEAEVDDYMNGRTPDMLATHRARMGQGNPLLECAGIIIGGRIGEIEGDSTFILVGETIETSAGKDITVLIKRKMLRGVSLFGLPTEFEENKDGGADVDRMRLVGTDFTNDGGNLIQFKDKKNAGFAVMN